MTPRTPCLGHALAAAVLLCAAPAAQLSNGSFETGTFAGFVTQDLVPPLFPLSVSKAGATPGFGLFSSAPTDGMFSAVHGFDAGTTGTISIAQDVCLPGTATGLAFDWRSGHNLTFGATKDRLFRVDVEPWGGGAALQTTLIYTAVAGTVVLDTGPRSSTVNLAPFAGMSVRLAFEFDVPQALTGPAFFELDRVRVLGDALTVTTGSISLASGGSQAFSLDAGAAHAGDIYLLLGTLSGTTPGQKLGGQLLPLNADLYFLFTLLTPNVSVLKSSLGLLDASGRATAALTLPAGTGASLAGTLAHHAFLLFGVPFVSNAVAVTLVP